MAEPLAIRSVRIENFRGFRAEQAIDLAASATVVSGPNGKGKTSFFDAVQWLLLGSLSRLADLASRRSGDYIVNSFAPRGAVATVSAELELNGRLVSLTRSGDHKTSELQWVDAEHALEGVDAERALCTGFLGDPEISLADTVLTSGILQQDVVRAVLQEEPKNRYRHMAALLGLDEIAGFEDEAKRRAGEVGERAKRAREHHAAAEQRLREVNGEYARLEQRLSSEPEIAAAREKLESDTTAHAAAFEAISLPGHSGEAVRLAHLARSLRDTADELLFRSKSLDEQDAALPGVDAKQLADVEVEIERLSRASSAAQDALDRALAKEREAQQRASQLAELATRALPLLGKQCPVCGQSIKRTEVEAHLRELIDAGGEDLPALAKASSDAEEQTTRVLATLRELTDRRDQIRAQAERRKQLDESRRGLAQDSSDLASRDPRLRAEIRERLGTGDTRALQEVRTSADVLAGVADQLASLLGTSGLAEEVQRVRENIETQTATLRELSEAAAQSSLEAETAKTLASAATRAIAGVTKDRFASLQPLVDDIFARLAPHPAFTSLGFEMGVAYRSGIADPFVSDPESGVTGDPLLVFSSSQANVAALTYFLALSWASTAKALPFLLLDDPLQSMDDVNALGFSDLCRHLRTRRQLVVSTHEQRLSGLLERKLTPRTQTERTRVLRFTGWDRDGPTIEQEDVEPEVVGYLLEAG